MPFFFFANKKKKDQARLKTGITLCTTAPTFMKEYAESQNV